MLRLAVPVLLEQLLVMQVGFVDIWLAGNFLESEHLAAMGLMSYILWLIPCVFGAVAVGATAMVARFTGAGDWSMAIRVTHQSLVIGAGVAAATTLFFSLLGHQFVAMLQLPGEAARLATVYLWILTPVIPAMMVEQVGIACLRGAGDTVSGFLAMSVVNVVNVTLSAALVTGWGPFPNLGWAGLAVGTAVGYAVAGAIILVMLLHGRAGLRVTWTGLAPDRDLIRRILRIGLPAGVDMVSIVLCHLWFLSIINSLGVLASAAHGLGVRIESIAYLPGTAFQVAAATLAGQYLGAGDYRRATRSVLTACLMGGGMMSSAGLLFFFGGRWLTAIFLGPSAIETQALTVPLLKIVALSQPSLAIAMVLSGALRGAGDTRWPLVFTFLGFLGVRIPLAYFLAWDEVPIAWLGVTLNGYGLGVIGAWYAMITDVLVRSLLVLVRFFHGGWKSIRL